MTKTILSITIASILLLGSISFAVSASAGAGPEDSDMDGITDDLDLCPGTPSNTDVDANGCPIVSVEIDIKPGSYPSSVKCKNDKGSVPVAVFGSDTFDVATIDLSTLELTYDEEDPVIVTEVHNVIHVQDKNDDGYDDAVLHLDRAGICDAIEEAPKKQEVDVTLSGSTTENPSQDFEGIGDITIVN